MKEKKKPKAILLELETNTPFDIMGEIENIGVNWERKQLLAFDNDYKSAILIFYTKDKGVVRFICPNEETEFELAYGFRDEPDPRFNKKFSYNEASKAIELAIEFMNKKQKIVKQGR